MECAGDPSFGKGNGYNPTTGKMFHPDLYHPAPIGLHWDYTDTNGIDYRIMPDGSIIPKKGGN